MALLPSPPLRAPFYFPELHTVASFLMYDNSRICRFSGYVVSIQARYCNEEGFLWFSNDILFTSFYRKQKSDSRRCAYNEHL